LSFEFSNAGTIVAIWQIFTCSVVFAGTVKAVVHHWQRKDRKDTRWIWLKKQQPKQQQQRKTTTTITNLIREK